MICLHIRNKSFKCYGVVLYVCAYNTINKIMPCAANPYSMKMAIIISITAMVSMGLFFKNASSTIPAISNQNILLKVFFPELSGNLGQYEVALPLGYITYGLEDFGAEGVLWGSEKDIKQISTSTEALQ